MDSFKLALDVVRKLCEQDVLNNTKLNEGYIFTLKAINTKQVYIKYIHILVTSYPSVFYSISNESNWVDTNVNEFINTSNHQECWKYSGFIEIENLTGFDKCEFYTGNFGFKLYEKVKITKTRKNTYFYNLEKIER